VLKFGSSDEGFVARILGRGTMNESPGFQSFITAVLDCEPDASVVLDLEDCEYLDSTFLGCLVALHKKFSREQPPRFVVNAGRETRRRLLSPTRVDKVLELTDTDLPLPDRWVDIPDKSLDRREFGLHLKECHELLAELGGPQSEAFGRVVEELQRDLDADS